MYEPPRCPVAGLAEMVVGRTEAAYLTGVTATAMAQTVADGLLGETGTELRCTEEGGGSRH